MPIYRDWRNDKEYAFTKDLDLLGWAWEFLRRNEEYQQDWRNELQIYFESDRVLGARHFDPVTNEYRRNSAFLPSDDKVLSLPNGRTLWIDHPEFYFEASQEYLDKYCIDRFINPQMDQPYCLPFSISHPFMGSSAFGDVWHDTDAAYARFGSRYRPFAFDLGLEIGPQIEVLRQILRSEQARLVEEQGIDVLRFKFPADSGKYPWRRYLRIVDAEHILKKSATDKEINVEILHVFYPREKKKDAYPHFPITKKVKANRSAAAEMVKKGFKRLTISALIKNNLPEIPS